MIKILLIAVLLAACSGKPAEEVKTTTTTLERTIPQYDASSYGGQEHD